MTILPAISLAFVLGASGVPDGVAPPDPHLHPAAATPAPAEPAKSTTDAPAAGKPMAGMACDPEMHEKMMKRMERMEAMMEKMHAAPAADVHPPGDPAAHKHH